MSEKLPIGKEQMLDTSDLAALLKVCNRQVRRLVIEERIPKPIQIGRLPRWRALEIAAWMEAGCPNAAMFAAMQGKGAGE